LLSLLLLLWLLLGPLAAIVGAPCAKRTEDSAFVA